MLRFLSIIALLLVSACTTLPTGPTVMALPGASKNFEQFRSDDADCREFAQMQIGESTPNQAAADSAAKSAVVGTAIGAAAGGALNGRTGAASGAGVGLLVGALAGANAGQASGYSLQRRYDIGYTQCMYAKGHSVPSTVRYRTSRRVHAYPPPPPPGYTSVPPPPSGYPPPPPPGYPPPPPPGY
jgi:hypothetical protein